MLTMIKATKTAMLATFAVLATAACDNPKTDTTTTTSAPTPVTNPNGTPAANANPDMPKPVVAPTPVVEPSPIANAKNASEVTLFPEQMKVAPTTMKILTPAATIRTAPQGTSQVIVAKQGLEVTEVAKDKGYYLVLFNDPSDSTVQKAGWVYRDALESPTGAMNSAKDMNGKPAVLHNPENAKGAPASAAAAKLTCAAGQARFQGADAFCGNQCKTDADCKNVDGMCDGYASTISQSGQLTPSHYCVTNSVPGSTPMTHTP